MRRVRNVRYLADGERHLAMKVFKFTIPYDEVLISDALGWDDRPFTMPTSYPTSPFFNVPSSEGDYVIHAGDGYYGMSKLPPDQKTLIHELTHVWQGVHGNHYVIWSMLLQASEDDAYDYKGNYLAEDWDDYGPEEQAQMVEDWFANGMQEYDPATGTGDKWFYFIKKNIRGERVDSDWFHSTGVTPLPAATLKVEFPEVVSARLDEMLSPLLRQRFAASDVSGYGARVQKLVEVFNGLTSTEVVVLVERLKARKPHDELARYFFTHLSHPTRNKLMQILSQQHPYSRAS